MGLTVGGLGSGLDIEGMITKLMAIEAAPLTQLQSKQAKASTKISAWGTVKSAVAAFQTATQAMQSATAFNSLKGTSSDETVASVTTTSQSKAGSASIAVTQLAQAGKTMLAGTFTAGQTINTLSTASTITLQFGTITGASGPTATFTPDSSVTAKVINIRANATLEQAVEDINKAAVGVTARTVSTPAGLKVVVESLSTGGKTDMRINTGTGILNSGSNAFGVVPTSVGAVGTDLVHAQDAQYTIDDVPISSKTNTITDALSGSTITLKGVSAAGKKANLTVATDTSGVKTQLEAFVKAYNDLNTTLRSLSAYGVSPGKGQAPVGGGALSGDSTIRAIQIEMRAMFNQPVPGAPKGYSSMVDIGVTFAKDGTLSLDSSKLSTALTNNPDGVRQLLMGRAQFSQSGFTAINSNSLTKNGTSTIEVTSVPTKAKLVGGAVAATFPANLTGANVLKLSIDGTLITANLATSYGSAAAMAAGMQTAINTSLPATRQVTVAYNSGKFEITSGKTGNTSKVEVLSGTTLSPSFGLTVGSTASGTALAGKIGGVAALADDSSMTLIGATGSGVSGLKIRVDTPTLGSRGSVSFARGFAYNLGDTLSRVLSLNGPIETRKSSLNSDISRIDDQVDRVNDKLVRMETTLRKQFTAMDSTVGKYNQLSTYLASQLKALTGSSS
ncbi:flagellar filament capping protein FliD [Rivihabitans pingtungensis]|uniref:flagellar filament capping protein FliD n=1 Tax=Rivihabitans pingtungensis TaxID=1054498 RepID=UPI00235783E2|nr:flagellar filament capping protein FliD [Rivihabitans pingtungensis]MCK6435460.1 flagellar filament capping protein FliD [Rivihabitans pingtungensis]